MKRLSQWLTSRGTRFSQPRPEGVALKAHDSITGSVRAGMRRGLGRSKKHAEAAHVAPVAEQRGGEIAAVHPLQDGGGSGVYLVEHEPGSERSENRARKAMNPLLEHVTLVVYGWKSVEPGTLSWVFPSVGAAVAAARAMRNAVKWAIVAGRRGELAESEASNDAQDALLEEARAKGAVLIEQAG